MIKKNLIDPRLEKHYWNLEHIFTIIEQEFFKEEQDLVYCRDIDYPMNEFGINTRTKIGDFSKTQERLI